MGRERDVVVVGGGHNGLACAAYLARAGMDVLVLERRDVLGGAAVTEEPWPGYRISTASYVVSLMPPRIVAELALPRFGYRVSIVEPDYWVPYPEFDRYLSRLARLVRELLFVVPPNLRIGELPRWAALARRLRRWSGRD